MGMSPSIRFVFNELLENILENSSTADLLEHRLVSRQWREVATKVLLKRNSLKVQFEFEWSSKRYPTFYSFKPGSKLDKNLVCEDHRDQNHRFLRDTFDRTLSDFLELVTPASPDPDQIESKSSLPVSSFEFSAGPPYPTINMVKEGPELASFFQQYGHKIKSLSLDHDVCHFFGGKAINQFISEYSSNLESLNFFKLASYQILTPAENRSDLTLLKSINISDADLAHRVLEILPNLMEISPQLQRVTVQRLSDPAKFRALLLPSKGALNSQIDIETLILDARRGIDIWEGVAQIMTDYRQTLALKKIQLTTYLNNSLRTPDVWQRAVTALRQILEENSNSLKDIELTNFAAHYLHAVPHLPVLPNVTKLSVSCFAGSAHYLSNPANSMDVDDNDFLQGNDNRLSRLLPNLAALKLCITSSCSDRQDVLQWFPFSSDELKTVKALEFKAEPRKNVDTRLYSRIFQLCPEVNKFSSNWPFRCYPLLVQPLWSLSQLTKVNITFTDDNSRADSFLDLDAVITGLPRETVSGIYDHWKMSGRWEQPKSDQGDVEHPLERVNPSILNLQNLRKLQLKFETSEEPKVCISGVSAQFGFGAMENLEVAIVLGWSRYGVWCCTECGKEERERLVDELLELHNPLLTFSNVTLEGDKNQRLLG